MNILSDFQHKKLNEALLRIFKTSFPENHAVQAGLQELVSKKSSWISRLTERFNNRLVSIDNQYTITELNQQFLLDQQHDLLRNRVLGAQNPTQVDPRNWIVKNHKGWKGWNPYINSYFEQNIEYGDVLKFDQFRHLIIQDKESKALNLILTIQNLI
jgi:hypothetical protein